MKFWEVETLSVLFISGEEPSLAERKETVQFVTACASLSLGDGSVCPGRGIHRIISYQGNSKEVDLYHLGKNDLDGHPRTASVCLTGFTGTEQVHWAPLQRTVGVPCRGMCGSHTEMEFCSIRYRTSEQSKQTKNWVIFLGNKSSYWISWLYGKLE